MSTVEKETDRNVKFCSFSLQILCFGSRKRMKKSQLKPLKLRSCSCGNFHKTFTRFRLKLSALQNSYWISLISLHACMLLVISLKIRNHLSRKVYKFQNFVFKSTKSRYPLPFTHQRGRRRNPSAWNDPMRCFSFLSYRHETKILGSLF